MSPLRLGAAAAGDAVAVIQGAGACIDVQSTEERNWADLIPDMIRVIGDMLLGDDVADYMSMRAVCSSWRSSNDKPTWETKYYPRNWVMLLEDEDEGDDEEDMEVVDVVIGEAEEAEKEEDMEEVDAVTEAVAALALQQAEGEEEEEEPRVAHRFVNVRTGAMLRVLLPSFEKNGHVHVPINAEGLHLIYYKQLDRMHLINPLTGAVAVFPGLSLLEKFVSLKFCSAGIVFDENAPERPTVVLAAVLTSHDNYAVLLCAKPDDEHWGAVDTSAMEVHEDGRTRPSLLGCLSLHGRLYVPERDGDVLRVELLPHPRLVYVSRLPPPHCRCDICSIAIVYLAPPLDGGAAGNKDDTVMVRVFGVGGDVQVLGIHFGTGTYRTIDGFDNRTIFVPGVTVQTDRFASLLEEIPPNGSAVRIDDFIDNYIL